MLDYTQQFPAGAKDGDPVILLLHGRGGTKNDLLGRWLRRCPQTP